MITDILQIIVTYCTQYNAVTCIQLNSDTYTNLYIYRLDISKNNANQKIIEQKKFSKLKILQCSSHSDINNQIYYETKGYHGMVLLDKNDICIKKILKIDSYNCNPHIHNIKHLSNTLEILCCGGFSNIDQNNLDHLKKLKIAPCFL